MHKGITHECVYTAEALLTRSVQDAVVLNFSSISFPIFCTVTCVCLMALWAVWSLQKENKTVNIQNMTCNHLINHNKNMLETSFIFYFL